MLRSISTITFSVDRFDESLGALTETLGYRRVSAGMVGNELAAFWQAPATEGARFAILAPASESDARIRLVETAAVAGYAPLRTFGWNAAEFLVRDVATLAEKLKGSAYSILGGPRDLLNNGVAIALQAVGPSAELLYLTEINGDRMQATYGRAECEVDRVFIVVLGASDIDRTREFYRRICRATPRPRKMSIRVLAAAHGLDPMNHEFTIASAALEEQGRIEIDAYPESAIPRPVEDGHLPPGMSMVSFQVDSLDDIENAAIASLNGARRALLRGPDDELIELVEVSG